MLATGTHRIRSGAFALTSYVSSKEKMFIIFSPLKKKKEQTDQLKKRKQWVQQRQRHCAAMVRPRDRRSTDSQGRRPNIYSLKVQLQFDSITLPLRRSPDMVHSSDCHIAPSKVLVFFFTILPNLRVPPSGSEGKDSPSMQCNTVLVRRE